MYTRILNKDNFMRQYLTVHTKMKNMLTYITDLPGNNTMNAVERS